MAHFDAVLPGRVHRVVHDDLVERPEAEIRRLLDHLGLPFEPAVLAFHENRRPALPPRPPAPPPPRGGGGAPRRSPAPASAAGSRSSRGSARSRPRSGRRW